jgi:hypothetical protein
MAPKVASPSISSSSRLPCRNGYLAIAASAAASTGLISLGAMRNGAIPAKAASMRSL